MAINVKNYHGDLSVTDMATQVNKVLHAAAASFGGANNVEIWTHSL